MRDSTLKAALDALQAGGFSALVWDERLNVVGLTDEALKIMRLGADELEPPLGCHMFSPEWVTLMESAQGGVTLDCQRAVFRDLAPAVVAAERDPGALRAVIDPRLQDLLEGVEPAPLPPL